MLSSRVAHVARAGAGAVALACTVAVSAGEGNPPGLIPNPNGQSGAQFGFDVSAAGPDRVLVGAPFTDSEVGTATGRAYLFDLTGKLLAELFSPSEQAFDRFGLTVASGPSGSHLAVGLAPEPGEEGFAFGTVLFFDSEGAFDGAANSSTPSFDDGFGEALTAYDDTLFVIGAPRDDTDGEDAGRAFLFSAVAPEAPVMTFIDPTPATEGNFGAEVAVTPGGLIVIAARTSFQSGAELQVFDMDGKHVNTVTLPGFPGVSDLAPRGPSEVLVGRAPAFDGKFVQPGSAEVYDVLTGALVTTLPPSAPADSDGFGNAVAALASGTMVVGAPFTDIDFFSSAGRTQLHDATGAFISDVSIDPGNFKRFGYSLAPIGGSVLAVGAPFLLTAEQPVGSAGGEVWLLGLPSNNWVDVRIARMNDGETEFFQLRVAVSIADEADASSVSVSLPNEQSVPLTNRGGGLWTGLLDYGTLAELTEDADGNWFIDVFGTPAGGGSFSEFELDVFNVTELVPLAGNLMPEDGSSEVPLDAAMSWTDPDGGADALFAQVGPLDGGAGTQSDDSVNGTLSISDTSWTPPQDLLPGFNQLEVSYLVLEPNLVGTLSVGFGDIVWGTAPDAPDNWPFSTPFLGLGSAATSFFTVAEGGPGFEPPQVFPAEGEPNRDATGDLNADGISGDSIIAIPGPDLSMPGTLQVFANLGTDELGEWLGYEPQTPDPPIMVGREPTGVAVGQFNGDGLLDVAVSNAGDGTVSILLNSGTDVDGNVMFQTPVDIAVGMRPSAIIATTLTLGDSNVDLAVTNELDENVVILIGDGNGGFTIVPDPEAPPLLGLAPIALFTDDFDGNKCPDLTGAGNTTGAGPTPAPDGQLFVFLGNGDGTFVGPIIVELGNDVDPRDVSAGDFDCDGDPDIAVANGNAANIAIVENLGGNVYDAPFFLAVGELPRSVDAVDLTGDNLPDLAVVADAPGVGPAVQVLTNLTDVDCPDLPLGTAPIAFSAPQAFPVGADPNFVVSSDVDADGLRDLITVNAEKQANTGSVSVLITQLEQEVAGCLGDLDGDGFVNGVDLLLLLQMWGACPPGECPADLDGDGQVGVVDLLHLLLLFGPCPGGDPCPWDLNDDSVVDGDDLILVLMNLGPCEPNEPCPGDFDGNGFVGVADIILLFANLGPCPGTVLPPGPSLEQEDL